MKPTLLVLAAGMGSRYGGLKQMDGVGPNGEIIMDYSIADAIKAGFGKVVFVIRHSFEKEFKAKINAEHFGNRIEVEYVFQELDMLPEGFKVPEGREKPWGTNHAILMAKEAIHEPFAVINADDFYGPAAYKALYDFLAAERPENEHAMVAYLVRNTVTENGYVSRGVCRVVDGCLTDVVERVHIEKRGEDAAYTEDGEHWVDLPGETQVSMNCWAFGRSMLDELYRRFPGWLDENLPVNPLKAEYFLPFVTNACIKDGSAVVKVLPCHEQWYGMTYKEDLQSVSAALKAMREQGVYPEKLLD